MLGGGMLGKKENKRKVNGRERGKKVTRFHGTFLLLQFKLRKQYKEPCSPSFISHTLSWIISTLL